MKKIEYLSIYIGLKEVPESWKNCYNKSKQYFKNQKISKSTIKKALKFYNLIDTDFQKKSFECVDLINNDENLKEIFYLIYYILFIDQEGNYQEIGYIKHTDQLFNKHGNLFILIVVLLNAIDIHKEKMKLYNFDPKQIKYHIEAIKDCCTKDINNLNLDGIRFSSMVFASFYINGKLIQVGRLQYELSNFGMDYNIYIDDGTKQIKIKKDSQYDRIIYKKGDYRIKVHIPGGKSLNENDVEKSLKDSEQLILKYFEKLIKNDYIYTCKSWLLSPELKELLKEDSNIMKFQDLFYCIKTFEGEGDFLDFVFNVPYCNDYHELSENTTLQKAIKKMLLDNKKLYIGLGVLSSRHK